MTNSKKLTSQVDTKKMRQVLEIRPQKNEIPKDIISHADKVGVEIREINNKALEMFNQMKSKFW